MMPAMGRWGTMGGVKWQTQAIRDEIVLTFAEFERTMRAAAELAEDQIEKDGLMVMNAQGFHGKALKA